MRRAPSSSGGLPIVLLHGHGGDEKVMWIFYAGIPASFEVLALRGLYPADDGGFQWHVGRRWPPPEAEAFAPAVEAIRESIGGVSPVIWVGFSQGAALAFCCAAAGLPTRGVAAMAGYMTENLGQLRSGLRVFWAHGRADERVSIEWARLGAERLRSWGADVDYCESDSGHKVSSECLRRLRSWLARFTAPS